MSEQEVIAKIAELTANARNQIAQALELAREHNVPFAFAYDVEFSAVSPTVEDDDEEWEESDQWYDSGCSYEDDWNESSC